MTHELLIITPINDKVGTTPKELFGGKFCCYAIMIKNTHGANILYVSFDGGSNYRTISAGGELDIKGFSDKKLSLEDKLKLKGSGADTTFEILVLDAKCKL